MPTTPGKLVLGATKTCYVRYSNGTESSIVTTSTKLQDGSVSRTRPTPGIHHKVGRRWGVLPYTFSATDSWRSSGEIRKSYNSTFYQKNTTPTIGNAFWDIASTCANLGSFAAELDAAAAKCRIDAALSLKNQDVHIGAALGESREAAAMITDRGYVLGKAIVAALRRDWSGVAKNLNMRRLAKAPQDISSAWLEYQYGWKPLMADIHGAWTALQGNFARDDQVMSTRSRESGTVTRTWNFSNTNNVTGVRKIQVDIQLRCEVGLCAKVQNSFIAGLSSLGLVSPWEVTWELVPFSFVVDWFLPVGDAISALSAPAGLSFVDGYETRSVHASWNGDLPAYWSASEPTIFVNAPSGGISATTMKRTVLGTWPLFDFYSNSDPFKSNIRKANAVSLTVQQMLTMR